tara:strand:+ start:688 stop:945 length:258 start_codon:yes stop_codon:yes gene_type:complete
MKKIILTLALVFTTGALINAKTTESINKQNIVNVVDDEDCFNSADLAVRLANDGYNCKWGQGMSYQQQHVVWISSFDLCTGNQYQ